MAKARRTTHRSTAGKKLYAVRDAAGKFEDIQTYERAHRADLARTSAGEKASAARKAGRRPRRRRRPSPSPRKRRRPRRRRRGRAPPRSGGRGSRSVGDSRGLSRLVGCPHGQPSRARARRPARPRQCRLRRVRPRPRPGVDGGGRRGVDPRLDAQGPDRGLPHRDAALPRRARSRGDRRRGTRNSGPGRRPESRRAWPGRCGRRWRGRPTKAARRSSWSSSSRGSGGCRRPSAVSRRRLGSPSGDTATPTTSRG